MTRRHPAAAHAALPVLLCMVLAVLAVPAVSAQSGAGGEEAREDEPSIYFNERVDVRRTLIEVRVVDGMGRPVEGLGPEDFQVRLDGRPARVEAVDRVIADAYRRPPATTAASSPGDAAGSVSALGAGTAAAFDPEIARPQQLVVFFFQTSLAPSKAVGFLRLHRHLDEMIDALPGDVAAAVVAFDSHLKLHQDFTTDREALAAAIERSFGYTPDVWPAEAAAGAPALARRIEEAEAGDTGRAEDALALVAEALAPLPGEKALIYVGGGFGRHGFGGLSFGSRYKDALSALVGARVPAFVLDVTDADFHTLETGLMSFADETGGQFFRTHELPGREVQRIEHTLQGGRYLLLVEIPRLEEGWYDLDVDTRHRFEFQRVLAPARIELGLARTPREAPPGGGGAAGTAAAVAAP